MNYRSPQCPDRNTKDVIYMVHELLLHSCNGIMVLQYKFSEKWCRAVLDSDASSTVHGNIVCNIGVSIPFPHSCQAPLLKFANCPSSLAITLSILFFCERSPPKSLIFQWTPKILRFFILNHILSFKTN